MNRKDFLLGLGALACAGCAKNAAGAAEKSAERKGIKAVKPLVVYFSATGTTKAKAEILAKVLEAEIREIVPARKYSKADLNWNDRKSRTSVEMADKSSRPAQLTRIDNIADYDVIYLGFPIWWYVAPTIVNTFLEAHDLAGKTIVPFFTSGGSGAGKTNQFLQPSAPKARFEYPKNLTRLDEGMIRRWVGK